MNTIKSAIQKLFLAAVLMTSGTAMAIEGALLGIVPGAPFVDSSIVGSCDYDPVGEVLTIITQPVLITYDAAATNTGVVANTAGTALGGTTTYTMHVDPAGNLKALPISTFVMEGLAFDAVSSTLYPGPTLLSGDIIDFGIRDDGFIDVMQVRATLTGGDLAVLYPVGSDIGSDMILDGSSYAFSGGPSGFGTVWDCDGPKDKVGPIDGDDDPTCDLTIVKTVDPEEIGPFDNPPGDDSDSDSDSDSGHDNNGNGHSDDSDSDSSHDSGDSGHNSDSGHGALVCGCKGKVDELTLQYNGPDDTITITRKPFATVVFGPTLVTTGQQITIVGPPTGPWGIKNTLGTRIEIVGSSGTTEIHTSCSQPIGPGLIVDDWEVIEGGSKRLSVPLCPIPPEPCAGETVTYTYTVTNNGDPVDGVQVTDDILGAIGAPFDIATSEVVVLMEEVCITETTTNVAFASGLLSNLEQCTSNNDDATVTVLMPIECDECEGKVTDLTLQYNGGVTADVDVVQKNGDQVFWGNVAPGQQFTIAGTDNHGTLGSWIDIFVDGVFHTRIHTSCSQPIGPGLISGSFEVISGESRHGGLLCPIDPSSCDAGVSDSDSGHDSDNDGDSDNSDSDSGDMDCDQDDPPPPPPVMEGCRPSFWKKSHNFDEWTNYAPGNKFDQVFGVDAAGNKSLLKTLRTRGRGSKSKKLGKHAVAGLLNASNPSVNYALSVSQVIDIVQDAYATWDFSTALTTLKTENKKTCPLN